MEYVGTYIEEMRNGIAMFYEMYAPQTADNTVCKAGGFNVLASYTTNATYPRMNPYARGCWSYKDGYIFIDAKSFQDGIQFNRIFASEKVVTPKDFKGWERFVPQSSDGIDRRRVPVKTYRTTNGELIMQKQSCPDEFGGDGFLFLYRSDDKKLESIGCWLQIDKLVTFMWREQHLYKGAPYKPDVIKINHESDVNIAEFYEGPALEIDIPEMVR